MQEDMHYYGTYAMARAAGLNKKASTIIATAAQFTDDNAQNSNVEFKDAGSIYSEATAHHALNLKNIKKDDQRKVWVPFHFLPGNEGNSFTERLVCRKNSKIAKEMVKHHLSLSNTSFFLELIGITAHVYADTFAHYGFSGVSSRKNKIINNSIEKQKLKPEIEKYIKEKEDNFKRKYKKETGFLDNIKSLFIESVSGALGHGAVMTYPDRPYLVWSFTYEKPKIKSGIRNNPETFLEGCQSLYNLFEEVSKQRPDYKDKAGKVRFSDICSEVKSILHLQGKKKDRINAWRKAAKEGNLFASGKEEITIYKDWNSEFRKMNGKSDSRFALTTNIYKFYQAASFHRVYILRDLLPSHNLIVS